MTATSAIYFTLQKAEDNKMNNKQTRIISYPAHC